MADRQSCTLVQAGEGALLLRFPDRIDPAELTLRGKVLSLLPGVVEVVPGLRSLAVLWDPATTDVRELKRVVQYVMAAPRCRDGEAGRLHRIPVRYGGEEGPDLLALSERTGLTPGEVVALHSGQEYRVTAIGFLPGFPYLEPLPEALRVPRLGTPRVRVAAGSVAVAQGFCGIYPSTSPAGWWILGRTSVSLFDPTADPPARLEPGDRVRFVPEGEGP